jgi:hypothetical protein
MTLSAKPYRRAVRLYRSGLKESLTLISALLAMTIIGGLLTLWAPIANSGYWTNVAAAPPFALLVIVMGEVPLSIRASLGRCRNYRESLRRSASSVLDLLWLLEQNWRNESSAVSDTEEKTYRDPSAVILTGGELPTMTPDTYSTYLRILAGQPPPPQQLPPNQIHGDSSSLESLRTFLVFGRLREDLSNLALTVRQLEQEPAALLSGPVDDALRKTANLSASFITGMVNDQKRHISEDEELSSLKNLSKQLQNSVTDILQLVDAKLPDWAIPRFG